MIYFPLGCWVRLFLFSSILKWWKFSFLMIVDSKYVFHTDNDDCCTSKFALSFYQDSPHKTSWIQDQIGVCSAQDISLHWWPEIRVWVLTGIFGLSMPLVTSLLHVGLLRMLIPSFKPWITFLTSQLDSWPKNQLYWGKKPNMANLQ